MVVDKHSAFTDPLDSIGIALDWGSFWVAAAQDVKAVSHLPIAPVGAKRVGPLPAPLYLWTDERTGAFRYATVFGLHRLRNGGALILLLPQPLYLTRAQKAIDAARGTSFVNTDKLPRVRFAGVATGAVGVTIISLEE